MTKKKDMWLQKVEMKEGGLRQQLHVKKGRKIPPGVLDKIAEGNTGTHVQYGGKSITITDRLKRRAVLARTMSKWRTKRK